MNIHKYLVECRDRLHKKGSLRCLYHPEDAFSYRLLSLRIASKANAKIPIVPGSGTGV